MSVPLGAATDQGALDALKLSQELLLKIQGEQQANESSTMDSPTRPSDARVASAVPLAVTATSGGGSQEGHAAAVSCPPTDTLVSELAVQASRLRGMSGNVKRLLQLAMGEVQGALQDTRESCGLATAETEHAASRMPVPQEKTAAAMGTQTEHIKSLDVVMEELRGSEATARALEAEKARLDVELGKAIDELEGVQEKLREKTAQVGTRFFETQAFSLLSTILREGSGDTKKPALISPD